MVRRHRGDPHLGLLRGMVVLNIIFRESVVQMAVLQTGVAALAMWGCQTEAAVWYVRVAGNSVLCIQGDSLARDNANLLLGMSPEAIAAVDLDSDQLFSSLKDLVGQQALIAAVRDNAMQLDRAERELQALDATGDRARSLAMEVRSRNEGARLFVLDCRERVFGDTAKSERFRILVGEVSPWNALPLPYRSPSVSAEFARELVAVYAGEDALPGLPRSNVNRLDGLYAHLDAIDEVAETRSRIKERVPEVLKILESIGD